MSKKSKILCVILAVIFIAAIISNAIRGLRVGINYSEGISMVFDLGMKYETNDIKDIASEIWNGNSVLVQKVEVYDESVSVKVPGFTEEQISEFVTKINEKYGLELTETDITILYNSNERIRNIVKPYVIPLIIATALIVVYYSIRYRGVKEILRLLLTLIACEGIIYSIHALFLLPINVFTMPVVMIVYAGVVIFVTIKNEMFSGTPPKNSSKD